MTSAMDLKVHPFDAKSGKAAINPPTVIAEVVCSKRRRPGLFGPDKYLPIVSTTCCCDGALQSDELAEEHH